MPRRPGRPRPPSRLARRARPQPRLREAPAVTRARLAAAEAALRILAEPAPSALDLARSVHDLTDRTIRQVHAACGDGQRVACRSGCTYCCTFPVAASLPEVLAIAHFVREQWPEDRQSALAARVERHAAATAGMSMAQRDRVRLDCPFLEAGRCSVYQVRPVACRGVSSLNVADCQADYENPGLGVEIQTNTLRELAFGAIREGLAVACHLAKVEHRLLELVRAYQVAAATPALLATGRDRPEAFEAVTGARVFPGPWSVELDREFAVVLQATVEQLGERRSPHSARPGLDSAAADPGPAPSEPNDGPGRHGGRNARGHSGHDA